MQSLEDSSDLFYELLSFTKQLSHVKTRLGMERGWQHHRRPFQADGVGDCLLYSLLYFSSGTS